MKHYYLLLLALASITGCQDHKNHGIDTVIPSDTVADAEVHMSVVGQTDQAGTEVQVFMHRHNSGIAQFLDISQSDALSAQSTDWVAEFEEIALPDQDDPLQVYYQALLDDSSAATAIDLVFTRNDAPLLSAQLVVPDETVYTVTGDSDPLNLQSSLHVEWTANDLYTYTVKFTFTCQYEGREIGLVKRFPVYGGDPLQSPIDFDLAQLAGPPDSATDCEVSVKLFTKEDQTANQTVVTDEVDVTALRIQETVFPISLAP